MGQLVFFLLNPHQQSVHRDGTFIEHIARLINQSFIYANLLRDLIGVRRTWNALIEHEFGCKVRGIELHRSIFYARQVAGESLDAVVVGGHHPIGFTFIERPEENLRHGRTQVRV